MAARIARCAHCRTELEIEVIVDLTPITERLDRIEARQEQHMSELDDKLTALETDVQALSEDEARELADLQALKSQGATLTPEQEARLDALDAKVQAAKAAIDEADPAPAAEPAPAEPPADQPQA